MYKVTINKIVILLTVGLSLYTNAFAADYQGSKISVDLGYGTLSPNDDNGEVSGPGLPPMNSVDVKSSSTIALSVNYYQNENVSYQFYVAPPIDFDIHAAGTIEALGHLSTIDVVLPTALVNYTFNALGSFKPYIGAGINYSIFTDEVSTPTLEAALGGSTSVKLKNSMGLAFQAGIHFDISQHWYLNANYLWIDVDTTAHIDTDAVGTKRTVDLKVDPSVLYFSLGYRF